MLFYFFVQWGIQETDERIQALMTNLAAIQEKEGRTQNIELDLQDFISVASEVSLYLIVITAPCWKKKFSRLSPKN